MKLLLLVLAILPILIFGFYINSKDREKEPTKLLIGLFSSGILSCILVLIISIIMELIFPMFNRNVNTMNFFELAIYVFVGISLVEEGCKWLFTTIIGFRSKSFDEAYDIIVYSTFVALGFASVENILYVFEYGIYSAILRSITSVPGHVCFGIIMGYYLLLAKLAKNNNNKKLLRKNMALSFFVPVLFHGIYDYLLFLGNIFLLVILVLLIVVFFVFCHSKLKQISNIKRKIVYKNCPVCRTKIDTPYCPNCGNKNN